MRKYLWSADRHDGVSADVVFGRYLPVCTAFEAAANRFGKENAKARGRLQEDPVGSFPTLSR